MPPWLTGYSIDNKGVKSTEKLLLADWYVDKFTGFFWLFHKMIAMLLVR